MARKAKNEHRPDVLLSIVEKFYAEKEPVKRPKYSDIGAFARSIGYDIGNHIFQKSPDVREYIDRMETTGEEELWMSVAVYDTLDTERFVIVNNSPSKLKKALQERDNYYRQVTASAGKALEKNKELMEKFATLMAEKRDLTAEIKKLKEDIERLQAEVKSVKEQGRKLKNIVDTWVNPEIANELLKKEGLLKDTAGIIKKDAVEKEILDGGSDINNLIKGLFKKVESE